MAMLPPRVAYMGTPARCDACHWRGTVGGCLARDNGVIRCPHCKGAVRVNHYVPGWVSGKTPEQLAAMADDEPAILAGSPPADVSELPSPTGADGQVEIERLRARVAELEGQLADALLRIEALSGRVAIMLSNQLGERPG